MRDWNVVATTHEGGYHQARKLLSQYGMIERTDFFNVLLMKANDPIDLLETLPKQKDLDPEGVAALARVLPVTLTFYFQSAAEFEEKAQQAVSSFLPSLENKTFHLRMHRRGFKGRLSGWDEERFLDTFLLESLESSGSEGHITFEDPDAIIALETVGPWCGLSLWTRELMQRYQLLHLD